MDEAHRELLEEILVQGGVVDDELDALVEFLHMFQRRLCTVFSNILLRQEELTKDATLNILSRSKGKIDHREWK